MAYFGLFGAGTKTIMRLELMLLLFPKNKVWTRFGAWAMWVLGWAHELNAPEGLLSNLTKSNNNCRF